MQFQCLQRCRSRANKNQRQTNTTAKKWNLSPPGPKSAGSPERYCSSEEAGEKKKKQKKQKKKRKKRRREAWWWLSYIGAANHQASSTGWTWWRWCCWWGDSSYCTSSSSNPSSSSTAPHRASCSQERWGTTSIKRRTGGADAGIPGCRPTALLISARLVTNPGK